MPQKKITIPKIFFPLLIQAVVTHYNACHIVARYLQINLTSKQNFQKPFTMNALISKNQIYDLTENQKEPDDVESAGELIAIALLFLMVALILIIAIWSGAILLAENTTIEGPINIICQLIHKT